MPGTDATVTINEWNWSDDQAKFVKQDNPDSIWADYLIHNRYEKDGHIYMMGNTSPVPFRSKSVSAVQLAHPTLLWISDWTAARFNEPPDLPNPVPINDDWILLDTHFDLGNLTIGADGIIPYYRISGTYIYGHLNPPDNELSVMCFPRPPWVEDSFDRLVPAKLLIPDLITTTKNKELDNPVIIGDGRR